jgi:hypothetical protein
MSVKADPMAHPEALDAALWMAMHLVPGFESE